MRTGLVAILLVACSGGGVEIGNYQAAQLDARCKYLVRCGLFRDEVSCHSFFTTPLDPNLKAALDAGKLSYDGGAAQQCFDALATASCDQTSKDARELPLSCGEIFTGNAKKGDACAFNNECESKNCTVPSCGMACCQGTCGLAPLVAGIGQPCATNACVSGAYCDLDNTCQPLVGDGGMCASASDCDYGFGCTGATFNTPGICKSLPEVGQPCPDGECKDIGVICNSAMTCANRGLPGDACMTDGDCSFYYACDATLHCGPFPTRGMACTFQCSDDSWCNIPAGTTMGTCDAPQANGASCVTSDECSSHHCDTSGGAGVCEDLAVCI